MIFLSFLCDLRNINGIIVVVGDPCGLHTIEMNKHVVSRLQAEKTLLEISMVSTSWTVIITFIIIVFVGYMAVSWFSPHCHWLIIRCTVLGCGAVWTVCAAAGAWRNARQSGQEANKLLFTLLINPCHCGVDGWCLWFQVEHRTQ